MPSRSALIVISTCESFLERALSVDEKDRCEELVLNFYLKPVTRFVEGLRKKGAPKDFNLVYHPIINGLLRGAYRRRDLIYVRDRFKRVYDHISAFIGEGFSDKELEAIIFMADDCTDKEIDAGIQTARHKGAHHACYVRAVIDGNRKAASKFINIVNPNKKKFIPQSYTYDRKTDVPRVDAIRDEWRKRVRKAKRIIEENTGALNAKKGVEKRDKK